MDASIYQWPEHILVDESTEEYEYFRYVPHSETNQTLNGVGEIRFTIESQSTFVHPSRSYLYFNPFPNDKF